MVVGSLASSAILALAFVLYELRQRFPMLDVRLLPIPGLSMGSVALVALFLAMLRMMFLLTQYLQFGRGHSPLETGLLLCPLPLGFVVGSMVSERLGASIGANRVTRRRYIWPGPGTLHRAGLAFEDGRLAAQDAAN